MGGYIKDQPSGTIYISTLKLDDTDASNYLTFDWSENDSADRTLGVAVGGGNRVLTLSGNPTLGDWFDQSVKTTASPTFAGTTLASAGRNLKTWWNFEDFNSGTSGTGSWRLSISGTNAFVYTELPTTLRPGVLKLQTGTTTTGRAGIVSSSGYGEFLFGAGVYTIESEIYITTLSDGTDTYGLRFGFGDDATADFTDGAYFEYLSTTSANWYMCTANNSTRTKTDTSTAVVAGAWLKLKIVVNAAGTSAEYFINGVSAGTVTTNIPTTTGRETSAMYSIIKSAGTTNRIFLIDWVWLHIDLTTSR